MVELRNKTNLKFSDIMSELYRTYFFPGGEQITVEEPAWLHVSESGGHRILDNYGLCWYIPPTWIAVVWMAREDNPHFVR